MSGYLQPAADDFIVRQDGGQATLVECDMLCFIVKKFHTTPVKLLKPAIYYRRHIQGLIQDLAFGEVLASSRGWECPHPSLPSPSPSPPFSVPHCIIYWTFENLSKITRATFTDSDYTVPRTRTKFADKAFSVAGPVVWNSLPAAVPVREADSLHSFKHKLKTHLVTLCFNDWWTVFLQTFVMHSLSVAE